MFCSTARSILNFVRPVILLLVGCACAPSSGEVRGAGLEDAWVSPAALEISKDNQTVYVASPTSGEVLFVDLPSRTVTYRLRLPGEPSGLALTPSGKQLLVTGAAARSELHIVDVASLSVIRSIPVGHTALAPVLAANGTKAYVCDRFDDAISVVDLEQGRETARIAVEREPVAAALTRDEKYLLVANHLPRSRSDQGTVSAHLSVVDLAAGKVTRQIVLPNGANLLRSVQVSPDGHFACVTHTLARFQLPTSQVERGWMNANALTFIEIPSWNVFSTVLLDTPEKGCANPWGASWSEDGALLAVAHAGTHEVSLINVPALLSKLDRLPNQSVGKAATPGYVVAQVKADVSMDLGFLRGVRELIPLRGLGPRPVRVAHGRVFVGDYFSESLELIDLSSARRSTAELRLHPSRPLTVERRGELLFNDARICLQHWQSCASCHSSDARMDGLNWDLLNDGVGNPKNTKSLIRAHQTAPAMSMGVRATAEAAVRAGIHHILFMTQPDDTARALDQWLMSLSPGASPRLVDGHLSAGAERGREVFLARETGCATCHSSQLLTDRMPYDVGTAAATDGPGDRFDTPALLELWRTAPYLHDGSALTLREVLVDRNQGDRHGTTSHLTRSQLDDLVEYLLSL